MLPTSIFNPESLPPKQLSQQLFDWTRGARNRLYRVANFMRHASILEVGAGWGYVSEDLLHRVRARIAAVDLQPDPLHDLTSRTGNRIETHVADVHALPFPRSAHEMVVAQFAFLWFADPKVAVREIWRVLEPGGTLLCIEPDYGGLMEHPTAGLRETWLERLGQADAHPLVGRELPHLLRGEGFQYDIYFCDRYLPTRDEYRNFLRGLGGQAEEESVPRPAPVHDGAAPLIFLPLWLIHARKP